MSAIRPSIPPKPEKEKPTSAGEGSRIRAPSKHTVETQTSMIVMRNSSASTGTRQGKATNQPISTGKDGRVQKPALPPKPKTSPLSPNSASDVASENGSSSTQVLTSHPPRASDIISKFNTQLSTPQASKPPKPPVSPFRSSQNSQFKFGSELSSKLLKPQTAAPVAKIDELEALSDLSSASSPNSILSPPARGNVLNQANKFGWASPPSRRSTKLPFQNKGQTQGIQNRPNQGGLVFGQSQLHQRSQLPQPSVGENKPFFSPDVIAARQKKSVSLGRNVNPKAAFAGAGRIAPLDLSFPPNYRKSNSPSSAPVVPPRPVSLLGLQQNTNEPPPPPPRLKRDARLSLSSPTEIKSPSLPVQNSVQSIVSRVNTVTPVNGVKPVYAVVDKEKKWAARQQKQLQVAQDQNGKFQNSKPHDDHQQLAMPSPETVFGAVNSEAIALVNSRLVISQKSGLIIEQYDTSTEAKNERDSVAVSQVNNSSGPFHPNLGDIVDTGSSTLIDSRSLSPVSSSLHASPSIQRSLKIGTAPSAPNANAIEKPGQPIVDEDTLGKNESFLFRATSVALLNENEMMEQETADTKCTNLAENDPGSNEDNYTAVEAVNPFFAQMLTPGITMNENPPAHYIPSPGEGCDSVVDIFEKRLDSSLESNSHISRTDTFRTPESDPRQKYQHNQLLQQADWCLDSVRGLLATLDGVSKSDNSNNANVEPQAGDSDVDKSNNCLPTDVLLAISVDGDTEYSNVPSRGVLSNSRNNAANSFTSDTADQDRNSTSLTDFNRRSWASTADSSHSLSESSSSGSHIGRSKQSSFRKGNGRASWAEEDGLSTGDQGDIESSDAVAQSSTEDIQGSTLSRKKLGRFSKLFGSFGKGGSNSSTSSTSPSKSNFFVPPEDSRSLFNKSVSCPGISVDARVVSENGNTDTTVPHPSLKSSTSRVSFASDLSADCNLTFPQSSNLESLEEPVESTGGNEAVIVELPVDVPTSKEVPQPYENILNQIPEDRKKVFRAAREILTSEQTFVDVLDLLTVEFPKSIQQSREKLGIPIISDKDIESILGGGGGLMTLKVFNKDLLQNLNDRISNWLEVPKISDIFVKKGPLLKLYFVYVRDFEKTLQKLDECCKNPQFAQALLSFEASDVCQKLKLRHYMLKPVQRIPQYKMLLEGYLHALEKAGVEDDHKDTVDALNIVTEVAKHADEAIKLQANAEKLLQIQQRLPDRNIIRAHRLLIKEGEVFKMCRKGPQPRYFVLLSDVLLCMTYNASTGTPDSKELRVRYELPLVGMTISTPDSEDIQNEFSILTEEESFSVLAKSLKDRDDWINAIRKAVASLPTKTKIQVTEPLHHRLGDAAPPWIPDVRVTMCQACATTKFTAVNRRHHCRACGKVVCNSCSGSKAPLRYKKNEAKRVCDDCYEILLDDFDKLHYNTDDEHMLEVRNRFKKGSATLIKRKSIPDKYRVEKHNVTCSGYLYRKEKRVFRKRWYVLRDDKVLYVYAAQEDPVAQETLPLLGYKVEACQQTESLDGHELDGFELIHVNKRFCLTLYADSYSSQQRWMDAIKNAIVLT